jgi:hypothetical protein
MAFSERTGVSICKEIKEIKDFPNTVLNKRRSLYQPGNLAIIALKEALSCGQKQLGVVYLYSSSR